jgi:hypothetical protein
MTHTTEEFVRRELRSILRGDTYRNRFVCLPCLPRPFPPAPAELGDRQPQLDERDRRPSHPRSGPGSACSCRHVAHGI